MSENQSYAAKLIHTAGRYTTSMIGAIRHARTFSNIERYCMFIGYPRSGHSLIGALLDAHPNMIVAHEFDALRYMYARFTRLKIYAMMLENSQRHARIGKKSGEYTYAVPNQWQGKYCLESGLRVIGDKKGGLSTLRLATQPDLIDRLREMMNVPVKLIHIVRNPYDNITTIATRGGGDLRDAAEHYFEMCRTVLDVRNRIPADDWFESRHEDFVANPRFALGSMCRFLGVTTIDDYLADCASIVKPSPHQSRRSFPWDRPTIDSVRRRMQDFPYLEGYAYDA